MVALVYNSQTSQDTEPVGQVMQPITSYLNVRVTGQYTVI